MRTSSIVYLAVCVVLGVYAGSMYSKDWKQGYENLRAVQKMQYLWDRVKADKTPAPPTTMAEHLKLPLPAMVGGLDFQKVGNVVSDEMPDGVYKGIHKVGVMCKGKFDWNNEVTRLGLTGSFAKGNAENVLLRLSSAVDPEKMLVPNSAWKILRDGKESGNFFTSHQIEAQKTKNWFEWGGCNHVHTLYPSFSKQGAKNAVLGAIFAKAGKGNFAGLLGVSEVGMYGQDGAKAPKNNTPFAICVQPTKPMHESRKRIGLEGHNFGGLTNIGMGEVLYHIYAVMEPQTSAKLQQSNVVHIGEFKTTDSCTTSQFGDMRLFFKHTYWLEELKLSGKSAAWSHVNEKWADDEGIEKYERFFKPEHKINAKRSRRRLVKSAPTH